MSEELYATEAHLQELLASHPDLLSADGEPRRWVLISREFGIASEQDSSDRWSIDHLFIDEQAIPTLVEVKRSTDTRIRREVVGQMLEYAANALSHWKLERIRARFEVECGGVDPAEVLAAALGRDVDAEEFWKRVETNLTAGRVRLMFVGDAIPDELRAIVEFLNQQMPYVEVLALELKQYVDESGEHQTLVPRLIGETQAARQAKGRPERTTWDRGSWLAAYRDTRGEPEASVTERLLAWAGRHDPALTITFGQVTNSGVKVGIEGLVAPFTFAAAGYVEISFHSLSTTPPFDALEPRREIQKRLNMLPEVTIPDDRLDKYPRIPVATLVDPEAFDQFVATIEWVFQPSAGRTRSADWKGEHAGFIRRDRDH
jgi:hypothetical protein